MANPMAEAYMEGRKNCTAPSTMCVKNICYYSDEHGLVPNGLCCQLGSTRFCHCYYPFHGNFCEKSWPQGYSNNQMSVGMLQEMTSMVHANFTLMSVFLGVMALLMIGLLALLVFRMSGRKRLVVVGQGETGCTEVLDDGIAETEEGENKVDGVMLLRHTPSSRRGLHSQTSYCCSPQLHSRVSQCSHQQGVAARMSHCIIRECPESPMSPSLNGHCHCAAQTPASPTCTGKCGGRGVGPTRLQSVPSQPSILDEE